jgi:hypothetical protein
MHTDKLVVSTTLKFETINFIMELAATKKLKTGKYDFCTSPIINFVLPQ